MTGGIAVAMLSTIVAAAPASAQSPHQAVTVGHDALSTTMARFYDRQIDLARGWQQARSCIVITGADIRCYRTNIEADAAVQAFAGGFVPVSRRTSVLDCADRTLCLYEHISGGGRRLAFGPAQSGAQELSRYRFENITSSWRNNRRASTVVMSTGSPSPTQVIAPANEENIDLGGYSDRAIRVQLDSARS
ncbi:peptidase inhibitor family I36 protein [Pilimelia columellifera]